MAVRFDASTDKFSATTGLPTSSTYTITCWIYFSVDRNMYSAAWDLPGSTANDAPTWQYVGANITGTNVFFAHSDETELSPLTGAISTWYYTAVSRSGNNISFYRAAEGVALGAAATVTVPAITPAKLWVGGTSYTDEWLNGRIASFKMWNAALDATEIAAERTQNMPVRTTSLLRYHSFTTAPGTTNEMGTAGNLTAGSTATTTEAGPTTLPLTLTPKRLFQPF